MTSKRLPGGGLIDRTRQLQFSFDGRQYTGHPGDTLASALLANDQWLMGRSFKYHRPRGVLTASAAEPNALVTVGTGPRTEPNVRATTLQLHDGLIAKSQNCWPTLRHDIGQINGLLSPLLSAGFYYKTFMWPAAFWEKFYEPLIRRAAGLGRATTLPDADHYQKSWAHPDLLVIGAGPAGLSAALTAGRSGASVMMLDEQAQAGGCAAGEPDEAAWTESTLAELRTLPNVRIMLNTTVFGWYDSGVFGAVENVQKHLPKPDPDKPVEKIWRIHAASAIMATGSHERPLVFNGNDRPGILLAGALQTYVNRFAVNPGRAIAIVTNNDSGYRCAASCVAAGLSVAAVVDRRPSPGVAMLKLAQHSRIRLISNAHITATHGRNRLSAIEVSGPGGVELIPVDTLGMSGGFSPVIHLSCQRGAKPSWQAAAQYFTAPADRDGLYSCGAAAGAQTTEACIQHGENLAQRCLHDLGKTSARPSPMTLNPAELSVPSWHIGGKPTKAFVDFQNDVTAADLGQAVDEGYGHVELAKRYTTAGMATDQGKTGNVNMIGLLADARQTTPQEIGTTTFRPFYTPVSFGALAGQHRAQAFRARRRSPLHEWALSAGACFVPAGLWERPAYFAQAGEHHWRESVDREVATVRKSVGLCDVSTLGKIELTGPDCATFLNRVYCNKFLKLPVGKARYGLMLREDGFILDDGTTSRLGPEHFLMTTTTGAAGEVMTHLEWCHQVLWPELKLQFTSVTEQWAQLAIAGPRSRELLQLITDEDLSDQAFPFLTARTIELSGNPVPARLFRISFSGELAYELAVPADYGNQLAAHLMAAGQALGICAYGTEAMGVMRIEKGFVTHAEIDGRVTPDDLGMGRLAGTDKDYVGKALLQRPALNCPDRLQLVGLQTTDPQAELKAGAHLLDPGCEPSMANDQGYVSSTCFSPTLNRTIALALLRRGRTRLGERIMVWNGLQNTETLATVCSPEHVDPHKNPDQPGLLSQHQTDTSPAPFTGAGRKPLEDWFSNAPERPTDTAVTVAQSRSSAMQLMFGPCPADPGCRWQGPEHYLQLTPPDAALAPGAGIELSNARVRLVLNGAAAADVLAKGCGINLARADHRCAPTLFGDIPVSLTRLAETRFELIVARSFSQSLLNRLAEAGREYRMSFSATDDDDDFHRA